MFNKVRRIGKQLCTAIYNACFNQPVGYVWMFHRVAPNDGAIPVIDELRVSPEYFRQFLLNKNKMDDFIDIHQFMKVMKGELKLDKPFNLITFDDGYEDNYTYAYPILKELGIPFVIYVSVDLINDHQPIWNYPLIIERIVRSNDELLLGDGMHLVCRTIEEKNRAFMDLKAWLFSLPYETLRDDFVWVLKDYLIDDVFPNNTLTWEQLKEMANDPLCTIGSHTMSHCRLAMKDNDSLMHELHDSKRILSEKLGAEIEHLSYPYGWITDVSEEAIEVAKRVGYKTGLRSFGGPIRRKDKDLFNVKRINVVEYEK
jgi:peptidoglycan/xylan/chitin deacetylase (PgdA/CDA1 family)